MRATTPPPMSTQTDFRRLATTGGASTQNSGANVPHRPGTIFARSHRENRAGPPLPIIMGEEHSRIRTTKILNGRFANRPDQKLRI